MYPFGNSALYGPKDPEPYCIRSWGKNWKDPPIGKSLKYVMCEYQFMFCITICLLTAIVVLSFKL